MNKKIIYFMTGFGLTVVVVIIALVGSALFNAAVAVHDLAFQLDGDISPVDQNPGGPGDPTVDWQNLFDVTGSNVPTTKDTLPTDFISAFFSRDFVPGESGPDRTTFATGSKDTLNITPGWQCARDNNVNDKTDLVNVYATAFVEPGPSSNLIVYFALERYSNGGAGNVAFWFLQDGTVDCLAPASGPSTTDFTGNHQDGDVLVVSEFTVGGTVSSINAYQWIGGAGGHLDTNPVASGADCKSEPGGDDICATVNTSLITPPWLTETKQPGNTPSNDLDVSEFFEGALNLSQLGLGDRCFNRVLADTRSSPSLTATIFDFAIGDLSVCDLSVTKDGDTLSKVGDDVDYTITIENTGGVPLYKQSIVDSLFGDLTDGTNALITSSDCGASMAPGDSCTIEVTRTVQEGDADPLPNTVTVVYDSKDDLLGDEITREDSHEVNLFQPSVEVNKTGTELSKVGDEVTYTFTLTNTSSSDSPDLIYLDPDDGGPLTAIYDSLLEDLTPQATTAGCDVLTPETSPGAGDGEVCTFNVVREVQEGDLDPLNNTITVHYKPQGFPNDIQASDSHSVNLFQPDFEVYKSGDELSKAGDEVTYTITIDNESSNDSPNLELVSISDTKLGDLSAEASAANCDSLAWDEFCTFDVNHTIPVNATEDPYENTVTVVMGPVGFPNQLSRDDDHSVNLFQPSVDVTKTGDGLSKVGDDVTYTFTIKNTSSFDSPNLVLFDPDDGGPMTAVNDTLLGDLTTQAEAANCDDLAPESSEGADDGESCTFDIVRTVQEGDSDPLDNTVTVHYNPDDFPNDISDSDDHSVNLFQPDVEVVKGGDTLSKVGDDVSYTFTIYNRSSDDSPNLILDTDWDPSPINDTLLGDLTDEAAGACDTLTPDDGNDASGTDQCTFQATYTVQEGDLDPLGNTVTVHYNPEGFPNDINDSDDHSVNLFQPDVEVVKEGDAYSKVGDEITYTFTIYNRSSDDSPDLILDADFAPSPINDTLLGDLTDEAAGACDTLTPDDENDAGGTDQCTFQATYTVQEGDLDPLGNTVTVHYNPDGFPNDINDSDDHSVDLIHPSFTVAKTCDAEPVSSSGPANFTVTIENTGDVPLIIDADEGEQFPLELGVGLSEVYSVALPGPFTAGGTADNTVTVTWTLPPLYGLSNTDTDSASASCDVAQPVFETAYGMGGEDENPVCFTDDPYNQGNWGWVNGDGASSIVPGTYEWDVWAGAAQCDTDNGTLVGTVTIDYNAGTGVLSVDWNIDSPYILGDTHVYASIDPPDTFSPGQWENEGPFDGSAIYIIAHAVVGIP